MFKFLVTILFVLTVVLVLIFWAPPLFIALMNVFVSLIVWIVRAFQYILAICDQNGIPHIFVAAGLIVLVAFAGLFLPTSKHQQTARERREVRRANAQHPYHEWKDYVG